MTGLRQKLNKEQRQAVETLDRPVLLLAVPGSGKTTTLLARIEYMINDKGIDPDQILTLTYTRAATADMKQRFEELFGMTGVRFQTINSLCVDILKEYVRRSGGRMFRLEPDTTKIVSQLYQKVYREFPTESELGEARRQLAYAKNMLLKDQEITALTIGENSLKPLHEAYRKYMRDNELMDYDDQLTIAYSVLRRYPEICQHFQDRYPYVLVDEAQDTSKVQHLIIRLLAGDGRRLFMVGDEDQSIYGFRAAYPDALLDFEKVYQGSRVLYLEENYRSSPAIVKAAGRFIRLNSKRKDKEMKTENPDGPSVRYCSLNKRLGQYSYLIKALGDSETETAVLYRNNESAIPLIYHLKKAGMNYNSRGTDLNFFSHRVVKDVRDFVAFANDPADCDLFMRIYYKLGLRIKRQDAVDAVRNFDPEYHRTVLHSLEEVKPMKGKMASRLEDVMSGFAGLKGESAKAALSRIQYTLRTTPRSEYEKFFILRAIAENNQSMEEFFGILDELEAEMSQGRSSDSLLTLSTVHGSKGLEYDRVFIIDAIDGVLPQDMDGSGGNFSGDLEEERRIFYVAMTRARNELLIMDYADYEQPFVSALRNPGGSGGTGGSIRRTISGASAENPFRKGELVCHAREGDGQITACSGDNVTIVFSGGKSKTYSASICAEKGLIWKIDD